MIDRILKALNKNEPIEIRSVMWNWCYSYSTQVEINEETLENMANNGLVFGFLRGVHPVNSNVINKLATALGILAVQNPEGGKNIQPLVNTIRYSDFQLLKIEDHLGFDITFPSFIGGLYINNTEYGIATERHYHYLWLVKRILELYPDRNSSIIEIGAGMGLLGYYLDRLGYKDYTVIDLSRTGACQSYFLWKNMPHRKFILSGEKKDPYSLKYKDFIKLLHSSDFINVPKNRFTLMVNMDGLTEMIKEEAVKYMDSDCTPVLLSINHEMNDYRICELNTSKKMIYRYPFWVRDGYTEELYESK
jgi:hypothetical protein